MTGSSSGGDGFPAAAHQDFIAGQGQEIHVVVGRRDALEKSGGLLVAAGAPGCVTQQGFYARKLLRHEFLHELATYLATVLEHAPGTANPLPDLGTRYLCRRSILHQVVDRHAAIAGEPGADVLDADADVAAQARLGHRL